MSSNSGLPVNTLAIPGMSFARAAVLLFRRGTARLSGHNGLGDRLFGPRTGAGAVRKLRCIWTGHDRNLGMHFDAVKIFLDESPARP